LDISVNSSFGNNFVKANNNQFLLPQDSLFYGTANTNPGKENETEFKVDYTEPLAKKVILGVGGKIGLHDIVSSSDVLNLKGDTKTFLFDSSLSNSLKYHQQVYAIYSELSFPVGKLFDVKAGGRYERTNISSYYSNAQQQKGSPGYNTFVPSIFLLKKLSDNQTIKLSYSKRIERPDYRDLNPFIDASDPQNVSTGNPYLKPEIGNRYELAYNVDFGKKGSFMITASYRGNNHDIQPYIIYYPTLVIGDSTYKNVAVNTRQNIGLEKNVGISLFGNINFTSKFNVRTNVFLFQRHTINELNPGYNSNGFNYRFNVNASYQFAKTFAGEFFGNYRSRHREAQGTFPSFLYYSMALRKQFWNKKGSLALTATNPFNEYINLKTSLIGAGFTVTSTRKIPFRSFGINFTWKFGKLKFKKEDTPVLNQPDEGG
jgi:ferric enterobactin receptor